MPNRRNCSMLLFLAVLCFYGCIQGIGPQQKIIWNQLNPSTNTWSKITIKCSLKMDEEKTVERSIIDRNLLVELKSHFVLISHHGMSMSRKRPKDTIVLTYDNGKHVELFYYNPVSQERMWFSGGGHEAVLEVGKEFRHKLKELVDPRNEYRFDSLDWPE